MNYNDYYVIYKHSKYYILIFVQYAQSNTYIYINIYIRSKKIYEFFLKLYLLFN